MIDSRRRDLLYAGGVLISGSLAGCAELVGGQEVPDRVPLYGRNERSDRVTLEYWCSTTASVPDDLRIDGVKHLGSGEESKLTDIPIEPPSDEPTPTITESFQEGKPNPSHRSTESAFSITAELQYRDEQRNVLLHVDTASEAFSEAGYVITVRPDSPRDIGIPGEPVNHESNPTKKGIEADYVRISPRSEE